MTPAATPAPRKTTPRKRAAKALTGPAAVGKRFPDPTVQMAAAPAVTAAKAAPKRDAITFRGRTVAVKMPTPEQLAVWRRTADRLNGVTTESVQAMTGEEGTKLLARLLAIITSTLVDVADRDWVEDQLLEGDLNMTGAADIIRQTIAHFQPAEAPTTGPAPKARRRA